MLPWMWTIIEFVNACFETIFTFMFADAFLKEKRKANWKMLALVFVLVWLTKFLVSYYLRDSILAIGATTVFAAAIVTFVNNKGKAYWLALSVVLYYFLCGLSELLAAVIVTIPQTVRFSEVTDFTTYRFQSIIVMNFLLLIFIKVIGRIRTGRMDTTSARLWLPLCLLPLISMFITLEIILGSISDDSPKTVWAVISIFGLVIVNIIIFSLVEALIRRSENDRLLSLAAAQNEAQEKHIIQLMENHMQIQHMAHDFKQQIQGFQQLFEMGRYDELGKSMSELARWTQGIHSVIATGNPMFDAILSSKKDFAEDNNISCVWHVKTPPKLSLLTIEVCALIGNAVDNAIEACLRTNKERFINLNIDVNKTRFLFVIENTVGIIPQKEGEYLKTLKKDVAQHGIGLKSMRRCCAALDGEMKFDFDENVFELRLSLPLTPNMHE